MQNVFTYLTLFFTVLVMQAQSDNAVLKSQPDSSKYEAGMQKAFRLWGKEQPWEAANMFERIAKAEPDNWLPPFYAAQINVVMSFSEKDKDKLTAQLKKAQDFINDATAISKENPEILVLQAQLYTAWIVFDGMQYGMTYSPKASELYQKALAMAPENPMMIMANAEWKIGSAKYFGESVESYCKEINRAIELSSTFEPKGKFYPKFSEERAKKVLEENCN
jgi:tetratricopeptide (TPR) repeat protein